MFCRSSRALHSIAVFLTLSLGSCTRRETPAIERLAVMPFENLSSDSQLSPSSRASAAAMVYDLAGAPHLYAQTIDSISGAYPMHASRILEGYFFESSGRLELRATLEDAHQAKTVESFELGGPLREGVLPLVNRLARRLSPAARPFGTDNPEAFRACGEALSTGDRAARLRGFETATAADPHFTAAYIAWAQALFGAGDRDQGLKIVMAAKGGSPDAIDRAELEYLAASATGDADGRVKALETLTRLTPADAGRFRELGELQLSQRRFQDSVRGYETAARIDAEDPGIWNELGYAYAFAQDLTNARRTLEHYQGLLAPAEINGLDSLGEVSYYLGDFSNAAKYFLEAHDKNPAERGGEELVKGAQSRLAAGDPSGGDALFQKYLGLAPPSERRAAGYQQAQWEFLTGRRKSGMARLEQLIPSLEGDAQSLALCQLSIWSKETGSTKAALDLAEQAAARAVSKRARDVSALCRAIAGVAASSSGSRAADAYAYLFSRKFAEAAPALEAMYRETTPSFDGQIRTLLAWAYVETGRIGDARKLLQIYPLPFSSGDPIFASLIFPRYFYLRAKVLEDEGKRAEAKQSYDVYLRYAGDVPDIFGDEVKARR